MKPPLLQKEKSGQVNRSEAMALGKNQTDIQHKSFKLPSQDEISFLFPGGKNPKWEMSIRKLDSQPVVDQEFGNFNRKTIKVSPPPKTEPFSDVYESEIELKEEIIMVDDENNEA